MTCLIINVGSSDTFTARCVAVSYTGAPHCCYRYTGVPHPLFREAQNMETAVATDIQAHLTVATDRLHIQAHLTVATDRLHILRDVLLTILVVVLHYCRCIIVLFSCSWRVVIKDVSEYT
jgi:hypothetical protein